MFVPVQNLAWLIYPFYCFIRIFRSFVLWFKRTFEEMCFTVQLSMFFAVSATAFIFYHVVFALSRTFLTFLKKFFRSQLASSNSDTLSCRFEFVKNFFHLFFEEVFSVLCFSQATSVWYHSFFCLSTTFFTFFKFLSLCSSSSFFQTKCQGCYPWHLTEKEGFEPSHGANRLYP